jgi:hypothetical protein
MRRQLAVNFGLQAARLAPAVLPSTPQRSCGRSRMRPHAAEDWYEDEEGMQLTNMAIGAAINVAPAAAAAAAGRPIETTR